MGIHAASVYGDIGAICTEIENDLHVAPGMRRDIVYWQKRQHQIQAHVLALLIVNGNNYEVGDPYTWFYEPSKMRSTLGASTHVSLEVLRDARTLADSYDPTRRTTRRINPESS